MRALTRLVFALVLIGLTASVFAANQTINFAGLVIPGGITSSFQWDGFQVSVAGGSQPYMQQSSGIRFGTVAPNENITMTIRRVDNSDFTLVSVTGFGLDENSALSVAGYNNGALVGSAGSFPANPSNNTTSTTVNFGAAVVDELRLSGQTSAAFAGAGELLNFVISVSNLPPTLTSYAGSRNYTTGGAAITLDGGTAATITDSDSTDFNGGYVLVTGFSGEVAAQDNLQVGNVSPISVNLSTGEVSDAGTVIGQVVSNGQSGADLRINLNGNSTIARVQNLIRALQYYNSELTSPYIHARTLQTMVSDGDGASPSGYNTTINYLLPADPVGSQKVNFNAGTMVPDISSNIATSITSQGFVFTISGGFGAYLQSGFNFPGSPSVNMGTTGGGTITTTITRTAVGTDFSLGSLVFGNSTSQNGTVEVRLNGASVQTRTVPGTFAQQLDFGGITVDEIRITGNSSASGFFQAGAFDELVYFPANLSPTVGSLQGDTSTYTQGDASVNLDASTAATVVDTDSPDFNGGSLTLAIVQNRWTGQDVLQIGNVGTISLSGNNVVDNGTTIGTVAGGTGSNNLVVTFNANATPARVQNLVRALQYRNTEANQPDLGDRSVVMTLLDGDGSSPSETSMTVRARPSALPAGRVVELNYTGLGTQPVNTTQVTFQSYRANISGGFQPYLQMGFDGPSPTSLYGGDTGISSQSISLVRSDNADFFGYAIIVGNFNSAVALTLTTRNNGSAVQTLSVPAGGTQRVLLNDTLAIDQIVLSGSVSSTNGRFAFIDELAVKPPNTPPTLGGSSGNLSYTENAAATAIDAALTVTDPDNNFNGGTLRAQLTGNASAADQLSILSGGTVTVSGSNVQVSSVTKGTVAANPVTGGTALVVTFNSSATTADVQAIARAIAFFNTSDTPSTASRTVTYTVTDAATTSGTRTRLIDVTSVNDAPALANAGTLVYTENQTATSINGSLTVSDADNATLASATVSFTLNYVNGQDVLGFVNVPGTMGNISGSFVPGTGVLSLSSAGATATLAQWQAALRAVTYFNASDAPSTAARNVSYAVNDGNTGSLSQLNVVTVNAQNDLPVLANAGVASYSEDAPPVRLNDLVTISDLDHSTLAGATITITANLANTQDVLVFTANPATMGNIAGSYVSTSGVLTLTSAGATATLSQWQEALRAVSYQNTSNNPSTAIRGISMVVNDGQGSSLALANTVSVVASNDAPTLSGGIAAQTYTENAPPTFVNPDIVVVDDDNATLATATVTITAGLAPADDVMDRAHNPATMGNIVSTYTSSTGTMQLSSAGNTATTAQWQAALRAVTYSNSSDNPSNATRTISIVVNDGDLPSSVLTRNMTVVAQNDSPVLANAGVASYSEDGPPVQLNDLVTVSDVDHSTLASATITITANLANTQDLLAFTANPATMGNISGNYVSASGVLTLTSAGATATLSQWQAALRAVSYQNTSNNPSTAIRGISMVVNDGQGSSSALANTVSVSASNDAPTLSGGFVAQTYTEGTAPTFVNPDIFVADVDNATLATATVTIIAGLTAADDVLDRPHNPATMGNIASTYTSSTGTMQLSSAGNTATTAQWQAALRAVTYSNSSDNPSNATRTISIVVNDGDLPSSFLTRNMTVVAQNDPPAISAASTVSFVEGGTAILASPGLIIADPDNATLSLAQVQINTGFAGAEDVLSFSNDGLTMGNIVGNYVPASGLLELSSAGGTATLTEWQSALRAVRYQNTSENPSVTTRALQVTANDGQATGGPLTGNIMVQAINDPPTLSNASSISYAENNAPTVINGVLLATDVDNNTLASATVTVVGGFAPDQDVLGLTIDPGTMGNISAAYDPGTGTLNLVSAGATASLPQWLNALHAITYFNSSDNPSTAPRTVQFVINDGTDVAPPVTSTINLTAENDAPVLASTSTVGFIEDGAPVTINPTLEVSDADSATLASATVSIVQNLVSTEDVLSLPAGVASANDLTESYDAASGTLTLTAIGGTTAPAAWQNVLRAVRYENTSENPSTSTRELRFVIRDAALPSNALGSSVSVTASNDAPILSGTSTAGFTENDAAVPVNQNLTIADIDNTTLASATISIGSGFDTGDTLAFVNDGASMGNISGSYAGNTLSLSSAGETASLLQWQAALRAVTFGTASDAPSIATRTVSFVINDGQDSSSVVDSTISMTAVNDPPTLSVPLGLSVQEDGLGTLGAIDVQDPDVGGGTMRLQLSSSQGVLAAAPGAGVTITGSPGAAITAEGTRLNLANWLAGPVLQFSPSNNLFGAATIALEVSDLGNDPGPAATATAAISVQIAAVPDADLIAVLSNDVSVVWVGDSVIYNAVLKNNGPEGVALADGVRAQFAIPAGLTDVTWTCEGSDGGACSASGTGAINDPIVLPDGGSVSYLITATVTPGLSAALSASFGFTASPALQSDVLTNNLATDTDELRLFRNSFE